MARRPTLPAQAGALRSRTAFLRAIAATIDERVRDVVDSADADLLGLLVEQAEDAERQAIALLAIVELGARPAKRGR